MYTISVNWMEQYGNEPGIVLHGPAVSFKDEVYAEFPNVRGTFYVAETREGFVRYLYHNPRDESGFGGATFNLLTPTGMKKIKGPWSSRGGAVGPLIGMIIADCALRENGTGYLVSCAIDADKLWRIAEECNFEHYLVIVKSGNELHVTASTEANRVVKPNGAVSKYGEVIHTLYSPEKVDA